MEMDLSPETIDFLREIELPDLMENCDLPDPIFDDIARLLYLLTNSIGGTIHLNLLK